ncbi:SDR family oxidoreductase [Pseudomonas sp. GX19020]|uniref:SDR family NAD(P)-dependent oxidoreductase n=1 Tax=Pseudomonas sp. GX19020 TaxID=2942277 RepID=UPI002018EB58|nr:SDR family oxidoreductase [Pseudomonas sp. GX19020]MCL4068100.1 SDR family oxidoreductase [Pseudomonas sp. GX19020]
MTVAQGRRVGVVTGGTSGIGWSVAERLAREGVSVVVTGRDVARGEEVVDLIRSQGGTAEFVASEVSDISSMDNLAAETVTRLGVPSILVNAAGILQSGKKVLDQDAGENARLWDVNYNGTLYACQIFGRLMRDQGRGSIVNIGSLASLAPLSLPAYTPGKAAVWSLTQILAAELGPYGVRVNAVAPGYTLSDGLKAKIEQGLRNPEEIKKTTALGKFVLPEDIAAAIWFLSSDQSASITGTILPVDAGWLVHAPYASYLRGNPVK